MTTARTVLITGATRGLGRAVACQLAQLGYGLFVTGRDPEALATLRAELTCAGAPCDLTDAAGVVRLYGEARAALGRVDVLINNAGFNKAKDPIGQVTAEDLDASFAVNVRAPILLAREALGDMAPRRAGHIVNVLSSVVFTRPEHYSVYTTMKHALHGFHGCLLREGQRVNVKVTAVYPGGVDTDFRPKRRPDYLRVESAAQMIVQCLSAPADVVVHDLTFRPMVETNF